MVTLPGTKVTGHAILRSCFYPTVISPSSLGRSLVHLCRASPLISAGPNQHSTVSLPVAELHTNSKQVCRCPKRKLCATGFGCRGSLGSGRCALCGRQRQRLPQFSILHPTATKCHATRPVRGNGQKQQCRRRSGNHDLIKKDSTLPSTPDPLKAWYTSLWKLT